MEINWDSRASQMEEQLCIIVMQIIAFANNIWVMMNIFFGKEDQSKGTLLQDWIFL